MSDFFITGCKTPLKPMIFELDIINAPPPLAILINPNTLDTKFTSKVIENRVRWTDRRESGYVFHVHHDELDVLSVAGKSAMFYSNTGLDSDNKERTLGWENIQQLVAIYRNNGINFKSKPGLQGVIRSIGRVVLTYDNYIYIGSFDNFTVSEVQESPFNLEFTFDFRVTQTLNTAGMSNEIMQNTLTNARNQ